ncbi:MAG TPA: hypothetical protein VGY55_18105 [Pirellulales bacterium]|nr:hypothetical protein [Pirellulales bacterium]
MFSGNVRFARRESYAIYRGDQKMKRIGLFIVLVCGLTAAIGCSEVKRKAEEAARATEERAMGKGEEAAREAGNKAVDSAATAAAGSSEKDAADAKNRDKLKGKDDDDK